MDRGQTAPKAGPLIVVSGPSGVGKTTVVDALLKSTDLPLRRAITATTRAPRSGEIAGTSYHFWSREEFEEAIASGKMFEYARVFGTDLYGTPRDEVEPFRAQEKGVILVIDVQGAARVRELHGGDCYSIFITPPSFAELEARLRGRGDLTEDRIQRRLATAREELARKNEFDNVIINANLQQAVRELERLIQAQFTAR
ncbi:MAG TPA: guanylate kinase [Gemmata sp.]|nr:guanylate kinase [Gemmata sp.]